MRKTTVAKVVAMAMMMTTMVVSQKTDLGCEVTNGDEKRQRKIKKRTRAKTYTLKHRTQTQ